MTRVPIASSMFLPWLGDSSSSKMTSVASSSCARVAELLELARAEVRAGVRAVDLLRHLADDDRAGGVGELGELAEVLVGDAASARALERNADEERPLDRRDDVDRIAAYVRILLVSDGYRAMPVVVKRPVDENGTVKLPTGVPTSRRRARDSSRRRCSSCFGPPRRGRRR